MDFRAQAGLKQEQRLSLKLSPQMLASTHLMELPISELRTRIEDELEKNPALEIKRESADSLSYNSVNGKIRIKSPAENRKSTRQEFIEGTLTRAETLQEHLLWQWRLYNISEEMRNAGELVIQNLNDDGFHTEDIELLLKDYDKNDIERALSIVQSLEPQGCAASNYKESLAVQARLRYGGECESLIKELFPYFDELDRGKIKQISNKTGRSEEELCDLFEKLKTLSPFPGRQFASSANETRFIVPDVRVKRKNNNFSIVINNEEIPVLGIAPFFINYANNVDGNDSNDGNNNGKDDNDKLLVRDFVKENIKEAQWFINSLNKRNHTVFRVVRAIVHYQKDFFLHGPKSLKPLTLAKIAETLSLHETTISRAANGKYVETEWGVFEIRYFFTNSVSSATGDGVYSKIGVKEIIKEIVENEAAANPLSKLSDKDIAEELLSRGIKIARRTVAKYRGELDVASSHRRH
jgi:RNA polymerase sigma-54 factor